MSSDFNTALKRANKVGSANADDAGLMAQFCNAALQLVVGAASPELVWNGAQQKGMTTKELMTLANDDPEAVHELMWCGVTSVVDEAKEKR